MTRHHYEATRRVEFDAAHRLPDHDGKCRRLHGHRYVVDVTVASSMLQGKGSPERGMVADFSRIDDALAEIVGTWDHRTLLSKDDPLRQAIIDLGLDDSLVTTEFYPTAENMAGYIAGMLLDVTTGGTVFGPSIAVMEVRVQETPRGWATWTAS